MKKHILLLVPDGTGVKNYLYSDALYHVDCKYTLLHDFNKNTVDYLKENTFVSEYRSLPRFRESVKEKYLRERSQLLRLQHFSEIVKNETLITNYRPKKNTLKKKLFYKAVEWNSRNKSYADIVKLDAQYLKLIRKNPVYKVLKKQLEQLQPEVIFCTHQRAIIAPYVFVAAKDLGIKTATVIYSWDNIPKARLMLRADEYYVWSQHMKEEMELFYPEIDSSLIKISGTPQFQFYKDPHQIVDREEFASRYGLDASKKWICYSGDDELTSPNDPQYLDDLASELKNNALDCDYQIVFRRCPVDYSDRFNQVLKKHHDIIKPIDPEWTDAGTYASVFPKIEDVGLLVNTVFHCEMVFNVGSTMAFDFLQFEKPCIYINYDIENNKDWSVKITYAFQHFRSMPSKEVVLWLDEKEDLIKMLQNILDSKYNLNVTKTWFDSIVSPELNLKDFVFNELIN